MDVYFSTIVRGAPIEQAGELIRLNWETKQMEACAPIFPSEPIVDDPNPRGNTRGGRGIAFIGDQVMCCNWHTLKFYDKKLNETRNFTHPYFVDLHEVYLEEDGTLFISSTALDAVFQVDMMTGDILNEYWPRSDERIQGLFAIEPLEFDPSEDPRLSFVERPYKKEPGHMHINTVTRYGGETYILSNHFGAIVNLDRREIVAQHPDLKGAHNLIFTDDSIYSSNTYNKRVSIFDRRTGKLTRSINLVDYPEIKKIDEASQATDLQHKFHSLKKGPLSVLKNTPLRSLYYKTKMEKNLTPAIPIFVRGLDVVNGSIFVGFSPATIAQIDAESGKLLDMYQYSDDVTYCIHGLKVDTSA